MSARGGTAAVVVAALALGCSRDASETASHSRDITLGPRATPQLGPGVHTQADDSDGGMYTMAQVFDAAPRTVWPPLPEDTPAPAPVAPAPPPAPTEASPAPPKVNPDDAVLERTRVAAGACFASLPAGPGFGPPTRSAHITVNVVPSGTISRADVTSDDTDTTSVLGCIQQTAERAVFSDNGGGPLRTYAIEVRVAAPGANGSR